MSKRTWTDNDLKEAILSSATWADVFSKLGLARYSSSVRIKKVANSLSIPIDHIETRRHSYTVEQLKDAVLKSKSIAGVIRELGLSKYGSTYGTLNLEFKKHGICIAHFTGQKWSEGKRYKNSSRTPIEEILVKDSSFLHTSNLKKRLIDECIVDHKCYVCGLTEWNGKLIPIELHHVNGIRSDNRIENLIIMCPNCHSQTDNYCSKNKQKVN